MKGSRKEDEKKKRREEKAEVKCEERTSEMLHLWHKLGTSESISAIPAKF